jgi:demethylmenaquinone methyltransferase/2-methoxy-6-polyprenyl-1,4-benzoquinol methylase
MPCFDHFDFIAPYYEKAFSMKFREKLVELAALPGRVNLLDAGGGTGRVSKALVHLVDRIIILDGSMGMLREASKSGDLELVNGHTEKLPFPNYSFEIILMVDALHHVALQDMTIQELWRALKPGGKIIIVEPDFDRFAVKLIALAEKLALMRSHFLSPGQIESLFQAYPGAEISIQKDGFNAWVICHKPE